SNRVLGSGSNNVSLAIDGNNKAIVVWNYDGNIQYSICNLTSCSASATLYSGRRAADLDVAMNKNGVAAIAWVQQTNDIMIRSANTAAERLVWSSAVAIDNNGGFGVLLASPKIGIDNNGNVIVVWAATLGPLSMGVFANQLGNKTNLWNNETAQKIDSHPPPFHLVQGLQLAVSESGNAVAVWEQGAGNIIASVLR
ncbi:MAG: hypothetical protein COS89_08210, partial [Deltaproteobacteria bacterium CG07_land_8_20_14_0_80_38_7]